MADPFYLGNQEKEIRERWQNQLKAAAWPPPGVTQCPSSCTEPPRPVVDLANAALYLDQAIREAFIAGAAYHASIEPAPHIVFFEPAPGTSLDMGSPEANKYTAAYLQAQATILRAEEAPTS